MLSIKMRDVVFNVAELYCKNCQQTVSHVRLGKKWTCARCGRVTLIEK